MPATTFIVVAGLMIAAEAGGSPHSSLCICFDPGMPLWSSAISGCWLTLSAMLTITGFHLLRSNAVREWIAERRSAWTLRHAATRSRPRHSAHRP
jgi:hypothetical protein